MALRCWQAVPARGAGQDISAGDRRPNGRGNGRSVGPDGPMPCLVPEHGPKTVPTRMITGAIAGVRKAGARRIAERGGTEHEVMSFMAHATPKEGATYTTKASRARMADSALAKVSGAKPEQTLSDLSDRLDKRGP